MRISSYVILAGFSLLGIGWIMLIYDFINNNISIISIVLFSSSVTLFLVNMIVIKLESKLRLLAGNEIRK